MPPTPDSDMVHADPGLHNVADRQMIGHVAEILAAFLWFPRTRHRSSGEDVVGAMACAAHEPLPAILVFAVPHNVLAGAAWASLDHDHGFRAMDEGDFRHLASDDTAHNSSISRICAVDVCVAMAVFRRVNLWSSIRSLWHRNGICQADTAKSITSSLTLPPPPQGNRVNAKVFRCVGFPCHCERSEAISIPLCTAMEIAASLRSSQ